MSRWRGEDPLLGRRQERHPPAGMAGKFRYIGAISAISGRGRMPISRSRVAAGRRNLRGKSEWTCLESRATRLIQMCITEQINKYLVMSGATQICSSNVSSISAVSLFPVLPRSPGASPPLSLHLSLSLSLSIFLSHSESLLSLQFSLSLSLSFLLQASISLLLTPTSLSLLPSHFC